MSFLGYSTLIRELRRSNALLETIMAKIDELRTKVGELSTALDTEKVEVKSALDALIAQIEALKAQQAGGTTDDEIQGVIDELETVRASLTTIVETPVPEPPTGEPSVG